MAASKELFPAPTFPITPINWPLNVKKWTINYKAWVLQPPKDESSQWCWQQWFTKDMSKFNLWIFTLVSKMRDGVSLYLQIPRTGLKFQNAVNLAYVQPSPPLSLMDFFGGGGGCTEATVRHFRQTTKCLELWKNTDLGVSKSLLKVTRYIILYPISHFTVVCLVTWPMNASGVGGDLTLIQTSLLLSFKCQLVSIRTTWFTQQKQLVFIKARSLPARSMSSNCKMVYWMAMAILTTYILVILLAIKI